MNKTSTTFETIKQSILEEINKDLKSNKPIKTVKQEIKQYENGISYESTRGITIR